MITSLTNLKAGLRWWKARGFPADFLNDFYYDTYEARADGITEEWWLGTVKRLGQWRAYRGRWPPNKKVQILSRGRRVLGELSEAYEVLLQKANAEPSITASSWEDIEPLYSIARRIKRSHVFAGKMCHFLFPNLFIVMDNLATQVFDYEFYWRGMKDEWERFAEKEAACKTVLGASRLNRSLHKDFPVETKVLELCHIGHKHS